MSIQTEAERRAFSPHPCEKTNVPVEFNDWGIRVPSLPQLPDDMCQCPWCGRSFFDMRRERFEQVAATCAVVTPAETGRAVAEVVCRLERPGFPSNGIVSHFGPHVSVRGLGVNVSNKGPHLQVTMYQESVYRPAELHRARAERVASDLDTTVLETWNGGKGATGISVVLARRAPQSLVTAIDNYHNQKDVFRQSVADRAGRAAFKAWYEAPLDASPSSC